jgi:glycosyltransferase involved in cell wall biosynthesis
MPSIAIIHDMACYDMGRMYSDTIRQFTDNTVRYSDKIITVSNFSRRRICELQGIYARDVHVIHTRLSQRLSEKINNSEEILGKYNLRKGQYIIYPSCFWRHKNHRRLLQAFEKYLKKYKTDLKMVFVGSLKDKKNKLSFLNEKVIITDFVDDKTFQALLEGSSAVIQCSLYEGFGMTVLEGMRAGKPVTASRIASIPEVAGDAVLYFDPYDIDDMCEAIHEITTNTKLRESLIAKGWERVKKFSDKDKMIDQYIEVFESVMNRGERKS